MPSGGGPTPSASHVPTTRTEVAVRAAHLTTSDGIPLRCRRTRVGVQRRPAARASRGGAVKRTSPAARQRFGDLVERKAQVVVEDHDGAVVEPSRWRKPRSSWSRSRMAARLVGGTLLADRPHGETGHPATGSAGLETAGVHDQPVRPGLEARRVAELRQIAPRAPPSACCVASSARSRSRRMLSATAWRRLLDGQGDGRERVPITVLRPDDQVGVHAPLSRAPVRCGASTGYEWMRQHRRVRVRTGCAARRPIPRLPTRALRSTVQPAAAGAGGYRSNRWRHPAAAYDDWAVAGASTRRPAALAAAA